MVLLVEGKGAVQLAIEDTNWDGRYHRLQLCGGARQHRVEKHGRSREHTHPTQHPPKRCLMQWETWVSKEASKLSKISE